MLGREFYDTIVNVKVGPKKEEQIFQIHKGVLSNSSPYFMTALDGVFKEGEHQVVELRE